MIERSFYIDKSLTDVEFSRLLEKITPRWEISVSGNHMGDIRISCNSTTHMFVYMVANGYNLGDLEDPVLKSEYDEVCKILETRNITFFEIEISSGIDNEKNFDLLIRRLSKDNKIYIDE